MNGIIRNWCIVYMLVGINGAIQMIITRCAIAGSEMILQTVTRVGLARQWFSLDDPSRTSTPCLKESKQGFSIIHNNRSNCPKLTIKCECLQARAVLLIWRRGSK